MQTLHDIKVLVKRLILQACVCPLETHVKDEGQWQGSTIPQDHDSSPEPQATWHMAGSSDLHRSCCMALYELQKDQYAMRAKPRVSA